MRIRILAFIGFIIQVAFAQETLEPSPGCIQFRIDFDSTDIDENCQFFDPTFSDAIWGTSYQKAECEALKGTIMMGQYRTDSYQCPDNGHLYTACCTRYDCDANKDLWDQYCAGQDKTFYGYCTLDGRLVVGMGCMSDIIPGAGQGTVTSGAQADELSALNKIIAQLKQQNDDDEANFTGIIEMLDVIAWQDENKMAIDIDQNEQMIYGITGLNQIGQRQLEYMQDIRQQTIRARFEQSGLLGNIELIQEEQLAQLNNLDSLLAQIKGAMNDTDIVDNSDISNQLVAFQDAILNTEVDVENDPDYGTYDSVINPDGEPDSITSFSATYEQELQNAVDSVEIPDYELLAEQLLAPYEQIGNSNTCPDFSFEASLPLAMGGTQIIDMKFCQLNVFGSNLWAIIRLILRILVNSWCALVLYRASLAVFSGTHKGTNWMNFS